MYHGPDRRSGKPGRREEDYTVCPFHEGTCDRVDTLEKTSLPRWVFIWLGGPVVAMLLAFTAWTALKATDNSERLTKVETYQEIFVENQKKLMEHFNLTPVLPEKPKG